MTPWLALLLVATAAILLAIFVLARQDLEATSRLSYRIEQWLVSHVPPTGTGSIGEPTWCGLTIRRLAHVVEYAALGLVLTPLALARGFSYGTALFGTIILCLVAGLVDEVHKCFVPGRHFDPVDLVLDLLGSLTAACLVLLAAALTQCLR